MDKKYKLDLEMQTGICLRICDVHSLECLGEAKGGSILHIRKQQ